MNPIDVLKSSYFDKWAQDGDVEKFLTLAREDQVETAYKAGFEDGFRAALTCLTQPQKSVQSGSVATTTQGEGTWT